MTRTLSSSAHQCLRLRGAAPARGLVNGRCHGRARQASKPEDIQPAVPPRQRPRPRQAVPLGRRRAAGDLAAPHAPLTLFLFRRTFSPALSSYPTARLFANEPWLVASQPAGDMTDNPDVARRFVRVGDLNGNAEKGYMGHVGDKPAARLSAQREYAGPLSA